MYVSPLVVKMNIAAQVTNFSFYHNSKAIYVTADVLEKQITAQSCHQNYPHFKTVNKGDKINLNCIEENYSDILELLLNRILIFNIILVENPRDNKQGFKFVFRKVESCAILPEN